MYHAELNGKLPSSVGEREDLLTSNVFSFLKYSHRPTYLHQFLRLTGVEIRAAELSRVKIVFWPSYDDGTEADVVIETDTCYLLVEAKYFAGIAEEGGNPAGQLNREFEAGIKEAFERGKSFRLLLITNNATRPSRILERMPREFQKGTAWTNWQSITRFISDTIDRLGTAAPDFEFASDLCELLDFKHLRGFRTFACNRYTLAHTGSSEIFFVGETASYRGDFMGFAPTLSIAASTRKPSPQIFYSNVARFDLPAISRPLFKDYIFFKKI